MQHNRKKLFFLAYIGKKQISFPFSSSFLPFFLSASSFHHIAHLKKKVKGTWWVSWVNMITCTYWSRLWFFLLCTNEVSSEKRKRDAINTSVSRAHAENAEEGQTKVVSLFNVRKVRVCKQVLKAHRHRSVMPLFWTVKLFMWHAVCCC